MEETLRDLLPEPVSSEVAAKIREIIVQKMASPVHMYVETIRAAEAVYGPEARAAIRAYREARGLEQMERRAASVEDNSLRAFCYSLEKGCRGTHEWEKLEDTETRQAYRFTRCAWAEIFRRFDAVDIGLWICEGDGPAAAAFNPRIKFKRTKTLMAGDDCCDHVYYIEEDKA